MGAPGAGKGTQASGIADHYQIPAISTGAIFRSHVAKGTDLGRRIEDLMSAGDYVPDHLTEQIVAERLLEDDADAGFLLDGFPRTLHQVKALDTMLAKQGEALDAVISLVVDPEELIGRMLKRAELEGRSDDNEQTIRHRMEVYLAETRPLLDEYAERDLLVEVDGVGEIDEVATRITSALDAKVRNQTDR